MCDSSDSKFGFYEITLLAFYCKDRRNQLFMRVSFRSLKNIGFVGEKHLNKGEIFVFVLLLSIRIRLINN
jgi:hypothetical protein